MTGRCDEVEQGMDTVVAESRVTSDTRLLRQNIIVLALEKAKNLIKHILVVHTVTETGRVDDSQAEADAVLLNV